ncbi:MAG: hypothetical protein ISR47_05380 [Rhodospirillales bacterium]|nr:hypothetical protein [Rhodospirillales bacterium]
MEKDALRRADFKTGLMLIAFCVWFLAITFAFMPFRETYAGVENVWYVSPWIFPSVVLTLLLILSVVLTVNAILRGAYRDVFEVPGGNIMNLRLTRLGKMFMAALLVGSIGGIIYLAINIEKKIASTIEEAQWLADPSSAEIFSWTDPFALLPLIGTSLIALSALAVLIVATMRDPASQNARENGQRWYREETNVRFAVIAILFIELVYILVPRVDFFVSILAFLTAFTAAFYLDRAEIIRRWMTIYLGIGAFVLVVFASGLANVMNDAVPYVTDLVILAVLLAAMVYQWRDTKDDTELRKHYRTCLIISWITPAILTPVFRFGLLVPLPYEGAVVEFLHETRYVIKQSGLFDLISSGF